MKSYSEFMEYIKENVTDYLPERFESAEITILSLIHILTKYGVLRKNYLKNHRRGIYTGLLLSGELLTHCLEIQEQAEERFEALVQKLSKNQTVTEELKQNDPLQWTKEMNLI